MNASPLPSSGMMVWLGLLISVSAKATLVLLLAAGVTLALRRASAALRHLIWTLAILCVLGLPALCVLLPSWHTRHVPRVLAPPTVPSPHWSGYAMHWRGATQAPRPSHAGGSVARRPLPIRRATFPLAASVLAIWAAGALVVLLHTVLGIHCLRRLLRRARRVRDPSWEALVAEARSRLRLRAPVVLYALRAEIVPLVCGWRRPVLLLPASAEQWSEERRRLVLLHELAHAKRADCLLHLLGQLARALYWFHPLMWVVLLRLRREREQACDDIVLQCGLRASDYAAHLLAIAEEAPRLLFAQAAAVAMANPSGLPGRVLALLDPRRSHRAVNRWLGVTALLLAAAVVAPLASARSPEVRRAVTHVKQHLRALPAIIAPAVTEVASAAEEAPPEDAPDLLMAPAEVPELVAAAAAAPSPDPGPELRAFAEGCFAAGEFVAERPTIEGTLEFTEGPILSWGIQSRTVQGKDERVAEARLRYPADIGARTGRLAIQAPYASEAPATRPTAIEVCDADGSNRENLTETAGIGGFNCRPVWSPDETMIAFLHCELSPGRPCEQLRAWVMNDDGSNAHQVTPPGSPPTRSAAWFPDSSRLLLLREGGDIISVAPSGGDLRVVPNVYAEPVVSPDGSLIVSLRLGSEMDAGKRRTRHELVLTDAEGGNPRVLVRQSIWEEDLRAHARKYQGHPRDGGKSEAEWAEWGTAYWSGPQAAIWSPDSTRIAFLAALPFDPDGPHYMDQTEVWIYDLPSNQLYRLTYDEMHHGYLWWT